MYEALGENGCPFSESVRITESFDRPTIDVPSTYIITCSNDRLDISIIDMSLIDSAFWILAGDTIRGRDIDIVTRERSVEVIVIGNNGCTNGQVIDILYDTIVPAFNLVADVINCINTEVEITPDVEFGQSYLYMGR